MMSAAEDIVVVAETLGADRRRDPMAAWRIGVARGVLEVKQFFRERSGAAFTFVFPAIILIGFGAVASGQVAHTGVSVRQYFTPGMIAFGMMFTSFSILGVGIAVERDQDTLKRLALTPMPRSAYLIGKVILVLVTTAVQVVLMLACGMIFLGVRLPATPGRWLTLAWVLLLSVTALTLLGIAVSSLPPSAKSASAIVNVPVVLLMFISGVFTLPFSKLPAWVQYVGAFFPVKWIAQGLRSAFVPDSVVHLEAAGSWEHGRIALVLLGWCVAGLVMCLTTFRWKSRRDG
jgi:ABC-2 type transport system permease protein